MKNLILAYIPEIYAQNKVYATYPSKSMTFSRADEGTRVSKDGYIESIGVNVPRQDWFNDNCPSLILEPQRTNLQVRSEEFDDSAWIKTRATISANSELTPNGTYTADMLTGTGTGTSYAYDSISFTSGLKYVVSVFAKAIDLGVFTIQNFSQFGTATFNLENGTLVGVSGSFNNQKIEKYNDGWYRCSAVYSCSSTGSKNIGFGLQTYEGDHFYLWGAQIEQGEYVSSYIKTESTTEVKGEDFLRTSNTEFTGVDFDEFSFVTYLTPYEDSVNARSISINAGVNDSVIIEFPTTNTQIKLFANSGGVTQVNKSKTISLKKIKVAVTFGNGNYKLYVDDVLLHTESSAIAPASLSELTFSDASDNNKFQGKIHSFMLFNRELTSSELEDI